MKNWALSVDRCWLQVLWFSVRLIGLLSVLLHCNGFAGIQKAIVGRMGSWPPNSDRDLFLMQLWLCAVLWSCFLVQPLSWSSQVVIDNPLFVACHNLIIGLLLCRIREDNTSEWQFFWFVVSSWDTHLLSFFTFPICLKCRMTIDWSMLSSSAASHVVIKGSASMIFSIGCQLLMAGHCAHLQGSHFCCKSSSTTTALYVR